MNKHIRTDLALELEKDVTDDPIDNGIEVEIQEKYGGKLKETIITIKNSKGAKLLGKPKGKYITIEGDELKNDDENIHKIFSMSLRDNLKELMGDSKNILVIGLGNRMVTPDALGLYVVDNLYITRHLVAEEIINSDYEISAISPGVMAQTGIETKEILRSISKEIKPDIIIAVDALAAREASRLGRTIQICDTGISPGSGVGNDRARLDQRTLGIKVIAIGVPTVISVPSIVNHAVVEMFKLLMNKPDNNEIQLTEDEKYNISCDLLSDDLVEMFVTPKNIDELIKRVSYTISEAINSFLEL